MTWVLSSKPKSALVIAAAVGLFVISMGLFGKIQFEFMPFSDEGDITITAELPQGYDIEETEGITQKIEQKISKYGEISHVITELGKTTSINTGTNLSTMSISMLNKE